MQSVVRCPLQTAAGKSAVSTNWRGRALRAVRLQSTMGGRLRLESTNVILKGIGARRPDMTGGEMIDGVVITIPNHDISVVATMTHMTEGRHATHSHEALPIDENDLGLPFPESTCHPRDRRHHIKGPTWHFHRRTSRSRAAGQRWVLVVRNSRQSKSPTLSPPVFSPKKQTLFKARPRS